MLIKLSSFLSFSFSERIGMICILWYALYKNGSLLLLLLYMYKHEPSVRRYVIENSMHPLYSQYVTYGYGSRLRQRVTSWWMVTNSCITYIFKIKSALWSGFWLQLIKLIVKTFPMPLILKPKYSFGKKWSEEIKSLISFVYRVLWILKALWIVLSETINSLRNLQITKKNWGGPREPMNTIQYFKAKKSMIKLWLRIYTMKMSFPKTFYLVITAWHSFFPNYMYTSMRKILNTIINIKNYQHPTIYLLHLCRRQSLWVAVCIKYEILDLVFHKSLEVSIFQLPELAGNVARKDHVLIIIVTPSHAPIPVGRVGHLLEVGRCPMQQPTLGLGWLRQSRIHAGVQTLEIIMLLSLLRTIPVHWMWASEFKVLLSTQFGMQRNVCVWSMSFGSQFSEWRLERYNVVTLFVTKIITGF